MTITTCSKPKIEDVAFEIALAKLREVSTYDALAQAVFHTAGDACNRVAELDYELGRLRALRAEMAATANRAIETLRLVTGDVGQFRMFDLK